MRNLFLGKLCLLFTFLLAAQLHGQNNPDELAAGNYVVVATFVKGDIAYLNTLVKSIQAKGLQSKTGFETLRNNFYVYVHYSTNVKESIQAMEKTREIPGFETAWVHVIKAPSHTQNKHVNSEEPTKQEVAIHEEKISTEKLIANEPPLEGEKKIDTGIEPVHSTAAPTVAHDRNKNHPPAIPTLAHSKIIFHIKDAATKKVLEGDVQIIDTEKSRLMNKVKSNEFVTIKDPKTNSGSLTLVCEVFGYRKVHQAISFPLPSKEEATYSGDSFIVNFQLARYEKGDMATLYQVFFHNDAAIMLPESKYELFQLLYMMHENPNLKIVLHGHTNGDSRGKIITMGPTKDFFNLTQDVKTSSGTSVKLSNERALAIREWLLSKGIDPIRVDVKPWGGKKMIHEETSVHAKKNIRVEVEVVEN